MFISVTLLQFVHTICTLPLLKHFSYFDSLPNAWCVTRLALISNEIVLYMVARLTLNFSRSSIMCSNVSMSKLPFMEYIARRMA